MTEITLLRHKATTKPKNQIGQSSGFYQGRSQVVTGSPPPPTISPVNNVFVVGNTANCVPFWHSITTSKWILNNVKGVFIPFITTPVQERALHPNKLSKEDSTAVDLEIISFFKGVIAKAVPLWTNIFLIYL
jgi:hypothetical protein